MSIWFDVCAGLERVGVERVFGVPGTQSIDFFEALRRSSIDVTLPTHELAASFMANGYARATGRAGVLATIGGPGFMYALTGLAEARLDSVPVVHVVSAPEATRGRRFRLQEIEQSAIARPLVKGEFRVGPGDPVETVLRSAYQLAHDGEPGPVLVQVAARGGPAAPAPDSPDPRPSPEEDLLRLDQLYAEAVRPVLLLGQGALSAADGIARIVTRRNVPVVTTPSGRGIVSEDHPMVMGFDVLRGGPDAVNELFERADLVLAIGAKLGHNGSAGFRLRLPPDRLVHVDREPSVIGANYPASLGVVADSVSVVERLERHGASDEPTQWSRDDILAFRERIRRPADRLEPIVRGEGRFSPSSFFSWLRDSLPDETILVTDSGQHQISTRRHYTVRSPRGLLIPSDLQSMGFGLPAAIGARLGTPERPVVALIGDGGFQISCMEMLTAVRDRIPLVVMVFSDGELNQIRLQQLAVHGRAHAVRLGELDYATFADAIGARYVRFSTHSDTDIRAALASGPPLLVEVPIRDSPAIRRTGVGRQLRSAVTGLLGPRITSWLKARVKRRR